MNTSVDFFDILKMELDRRGKDAYRNYHIEEGNYATQEESAAKVGRTPAGWPDKEEHCSEDQHDWT